jgi:hypothetical protein
MPLGQGIAEILEAIPARIEVSGHGSTWRITGPSFDAVVDYVEECFDEPTILACHRRDRLWPRVTVTVTSDPARAGTGPPLEELREQAAPPRHSGASGSNSTGTTHRAAGRRARRAAQVDDMPVSLDSIFEHQEAERAARLQAMPRQREG